MIIIDKNPNLIDMKIYRFKFGKVGGAFSAGGVAGAVGKKGKKFAAGGLIAGMSLGFLFSH